jgi:hypothetical protein
MHLEAKEFTMFVKRILNNYFIKKVVLDVGSGDINGANISRIKYGLSENTESIALDSLNDISELTVVNYNKPFYNNGLVKVVTNTETKKTYYLLGGILATGEGLIFGGNISATRIA